MEFFQHGMGVPSLVILLHEIIKLMYHAKVKDPIFIRIGTCGGIGIEPGSVVITEEAVDELLKPFYEVVRFKTFRRCSVLLCTAQKFGECNAESSRALMPRY